MPNVLASYMQGQQAVENNKRNKLLDLQLASAPADQARANKLADLQVQRQQQAVDAGAKDAAASTEAEGIKQGLAAADFILQSSSPKADLLKNYPQFVQEIGKNGIDVNQLDDEAVLQMAGDVRKQLSVRAGIGPAPQPQKAEDIQLEGGGLAQRDPVTGVVTQRIAPREDFRAKADYNDKLQRRRDAEQRSYNDQRDIRQADVQRELAKIRAASVGEKPTDGQRLSAGFLLRMQDTEPSFGGDDGAGKYVPSYKPSTKDYVLFNKILKNEGGFFGAGTAAELNKQLPAEAQEYFQQATDWVRAKLRKESGAAIGAQEMLSEVTTYFPLPGDSAKTIENKRKSRETAIEAMRIAAGAVGERTSAQPPASPSAASTAGPAAGTVEGGYRFKGGNPADPSAWEKL